MTDADHRHKARIENRAGLHYSDFGRPALDKSRVPARQRVKNTRFSAPVAKVGLRVVSVVRCVVLAAGLHLNYP